MRIIGVVLSLLTCLLAAAAADASTTDISSADASKAGADTAELKPFEVHYKFTNNRVNIGVMKRRLVINEDNSYSLISNTEPNKVVAWLVKDRINETTDWQYHQQRLRPLHYRFLQQGGKRHRHIELRFDWDKQRITDLASDNQRHRKLPAQALDKQLYQLQLMLDLQQGVEPLSYTIIDEKKVRQYEFKRTAEETITTPIGSFASVKLVRQSGKRSTVMWCAKELDYLPVKIIHNESENNEMKLEIIKIDGLQP